MNRAGWIIFGSVVVALIVGLVVWSRLSSPTADISTVNANSIIPASTANGEIADHVFGVPDSKALLVEYGDFQCPYCGQAQPNVKTLLDEYGGKIAFVFRNFPITSLHPNALAAAATAEAAGLQGKYWEMHDLLYANQDAWSSLDTTRRTDVFKSYALQLGLDVTKFETDIDSSNVKQKISFDTNLGKRDGVNGTPTFFLNGQKVDDATSQGIIQGDLTGIKAQLDRALGQ